MNQFIQTMIVVVCLTATALFTVNMVLDAVDREAAFQENIRHARCERMDDFERARMKGYCNQ